MLLLVVDPGGQLVLICYIAFSRFLATYICIENIPKGVNTVEGISDISIAGIDERRPPIIRKAPYIDIFFKLSHEAPVDWCKDFNSLLSKHPTTPKIKEKEGLYIESWVRSPDDIVTLLDKLKETVLECNRLYIERIEASLRKANEVNTLEAQQANGEQGRLNKIIAGLGFDVTKKQDIQ